MVLRQRAFRTFGKRQSEYGSRPYELVRQFPYRRFVFALEGNVRLAGSISHLGTSFVSGRGQRILIPLVSCIPADIRNVHLLLRTRNEGTLAQ